MGREGALAGYRGEYRRGWPSEGDKYRISLQTDSLAASFLERAT
jgi:hypothetical protein